MKQTVRGFEGMLIMHRSKKSILNQIKLTVIQYNIEVLYRYISILYDYMALAYWHVYIYMYIYKNATRIKTQENICLRHVEFFSHVELIDSCQVLCMELHCTILAVQKVITANYNIKLFTFQSDLYFNMLFVMNLSYKEILIFIYIYIYIYIYI